jgi:hypothetical protein
MADTEKRKPLFATPAEAVACLREALGHWYARTEFELEQQHGARAALESLEAEVGRLTSPPALNEPFVNAVVLMKKQGDELAEARARIRALESELADAQQRLEQADAELELYHPDRSGGRR